MRKGAQTGFQAGGEDEMLVEFSVWQAALRDEAALEIAVLPVHQRQQVCVIGLPGLVLLGLDFRRAAGKRVNRSPQRRCI